MVCSASARHASASVTSKTLACARSPVRLSSTDTAAVSGVYVAKLVRIDTGGASHIVFIVRDDSRQADIIVQTSDTTWQAYNRYGGSSLYCSPAGIGVSNAGSAYINACGQRATKVWQVPATTNAIIELAEQLAGRGIQRVVAWVHLRLLAGLVVPARSPRPGGVAGQRPRRPSTCRAAPRPTSWMRCGWPSSTSGACCGPRSSHRPRSAGCGTTPGCGPT